MDSSKKRQVGEQVRRLRARFAQSVGALLGDVIPQQFAMQLVSEEVGGWRERVYGPLTTLVLFIEQVLSADHGCQDTVARGIRTRVALGQALCSLNTGPYCKARSRLALGLVERLGREVGARLCAGQPGLWRWRGREVKLVDGTARGSLGCGAGAVEKSSSSMAPRCRCPTRWPGEIGDRPRFPDLRLALPLDTLARTSPRGALQVK